MNTFLAEVFHSGASFLRSYPQLKPLFPQIVQGLLGLGLAAVVAWLAWRAGALTRTGALAAVGVGGVMFGAGGWDWAALLLAFFVSSSALSHLFAARKQTLSEKFAKGERRDAGQVLANGGLPALLALLHWLYPAWSPAWTLCAGALAAVNADTWATELGVLSPTPPRRLWGWDVVERGESGGVTFLGTLASLGGSLFIALLAASLTARWRLLLVVTLAGWLGAGLDSLLGATIQAQFYCPSCARLTEHHPRHTCGVFTRHVRGLRWLNNDLVNLAAACGGALLASLLT